VITDKKNLHALKGPETQQGLNPTAVTCLPSTPAPSTRCREGTEAAIN